MRTILIPFVILSSALAQTGQAHQVKRTTLDIGQKAPALNAEIWLKGEPVTEFKKGKVYVLEFWQIDDNPFAGQLPDLGRMTRDMKSKVQFIGVNSPNPWSRSIDETQKERIQAFICKNAANLPDEICLDDNLRIADQWLPAVNYGRIDTAFQPQEPYAIVVDQKGQVAWLGRPWDLYRPLKQIVDNAFNIEAFKKRFDEQVQAHAAHAQLCADLQAAATNNDQFLFDGLVAKLGGQNATTIPFAINLASAKNPEFALANVQLRMAANREVPPLLWCNTLCILAYSNAQPRTKQRAAELVKEWVAKCDANTRPLAEVLAARTLAASGQKQEALAYLDKAAQHGEHIQTYIEAARKAIQ